MVNVTGTAALLSSALFLIVSKLDVGVDAVVSPEKKIQCMYGVRVSRSEMC